MSRSILPYAFVLLLLSMQAMSDCTTFTPTGKHGTDGYRTLGTPLRVSEYVDCTDARVVATDNETVPPYPGGCRYLRYAMGIEVHPFITINDGSDAVRNYSDFSLANFFDLVVDTVDSDARVGRTTDFNTTIVMNYTLSVIAIGGGNKTWSGYWAYNPFVHCTVGIVGGCDGTDVGVPYVNGTNVTACGYTWWPYIYGSEVPEYLRPPGEQKYDGTETWIAADAGCCTSDVSVGKPYPDYDVAMGNSTAVQAEESGSVSVRPGLGLELGILVGLSWLFVWYL